MRGIRCITVRRSEWYVVAVLFLIGVFNVMDRQLLSILLEPVERDLWASDTVMGALTGFAFVSFNSLVSVPIARAADVRSRRDIIAVALAFWSVMTTAAALVTSTVQLALAHPQPRLGRSERRGWRQHPTRDHSATRRSVCQ